MSDRRAKLAALKKKINEEHGGGTIISAQQIEVMPRLRTGSLSLDRATGGGIPVGRTTIFRGMESSGKTATMYRIMGLAQRLCANCHRPVKDLVVEEVKGEFVAKGHCDCFAAGLFETKQYPDETKDEYASRLKGYESNSYEEFRVALMDPEHGYDPEWAEKLGVDFRRLEYSRPDTAEAVADIYDGLLRTAAVDLICIDSIAAMTPSVEVEESVEKQQQALQARIMGKFVRKAQSGANAVAREFRRMPTQIWINQEREKIGVTFGDTKIMPGGNSQLFAASVIVKMWSSKWEKETVDDDLIKDFQTEMGSKVRMNFKIIKNKTAPAMSTGSYDLIVAGENAGTVDEVKYVMALAEKYSLIGSRGDGAKKVWFVGDREYKTKKEMAAAAESPEAYGRIVDILLAHLLKGA